MTAIPDKVEGTPLTDVLLVNIKLLTLSELKLITDHVRPHSVRFAADPTDKKRAEGPSTGLIWARPALAHALVPCLCKRFHNLVLSTPNPRPSVSDICP